MKEATERLTDMFGIMSTIIKAYQMRKDLIEPFVVVCDKMYAEFRQHFPLLSTKKRSVSYQKYQKVLANSCSDSYRQRRVAVHLHLLMKATS